MFSLSRRLIKIRGIILGGVLLSLTQHLCAEEFPKAIAEDLSDDNPRVRIGLKITTFKKESETQKNDTKTVNHIKDEVLKHTLRARLDRINHFFIKNFHIESKPIFWIKKNQRYRMKLSFFKRFGDKQQVEELVGDVEIEGVLKGDRELFILHGLESARFTDKFGNPVLEVVCGYKEQEQSNPPDNEYRAVSTPVKQEKPL